MNDTKAVMDAINEILKRGNDAQIQLNKAALWFWK